MIKEASFRTCPICDDSTVECLHHQKFTLPRDHPLPAQFDVVSCTQCGFAYADTAGDENAYNRYYESYSKYIDQKNSTGGGGSSVDKERLEIMAATIAAQFPDKDALVVDIGCANGGLLHMLKGLGFTNLLGVDPSPVCVKNTQELFGIPAEQGWLGELPPAVHSAGLIVLSHVLEHVLHPRLSIEKLRDRLAPGGMIYAETPDADRYVDCLTAPFQDFNIEHINHYGPASLENLFEAAGFRAISVQTKFMETAPGIPYPAVFGFFQKKDGPATAPAEWVRDETFLPHLNDYIGRSREKLAALDQQLTEALRGPVIVWGTGQLTLKLLAETRLGQAEIAAFVDSNPCNQGKELQGIAILPPAALRDMPAHPIIIGTMLHNKVIREQITQELQLANPVIELA
ncbi:class I SAM-dependent methyltransferase [Ruficoccus amylovorans]|uniref:Class I SAM-dependent methyltransferase n=1 Tax=Ruficoccus amylovorans TaxID=1804625 RepID=A0A842HBN0_9BACT|nr:class I SAM-dependent methyltransferase [Ruficoccus amylovorans]MBC2593027.1 class I SAM-dependent methyltransferase [Ruficoccus amylovorans]